LCRDCWVVRVLASIFHLPRTNKTMTEQEKTSEPTTATPKASRLRVLVVEDDEGVAATLKDTIEAAVANAECILEANFEAACRILKEEVFDAVVLDQFEGEKTETSKKAEQIWRTIWDIQFMPVVVYSAFELELDENFPRNHPVLTYIAKGAEHDAVAKHIALITPYLIQLQMVRDEIRLVVRAALLKVAPYISKSAQEISDGKPDQLARIVRRRIAARMDLNTVLTDSKPAAWEQYLCPPLDDQWLMGDILRMSQGDKREPKSYRVTLTPSCDLVKRKEKRKVEHVLVCQCSGIDRYVDATRVGKELSLLSRFLTEPQVGGNIPLPGYHGLIPPMSARIRELELIPVTDIGDDEQSKFMRVASVDSPFREQIAWAFVQIAGRPALPDRDLESWVQEIREQISGVKPNREK
jgi:hypothetical protein